MTKTTVYLPDDTKQRLSREAQRRGVSEASLIRAAIETLLTEERPRPQVPLFRSGRKSVAADVDPELDRLGFGTDERHFRVLRRANGTTFRLLPRDG